MNSWFALLALAQTASGPNLAPILASPDLQGGTVAVVVTDAGGNVLFEQNGSTRVVPASNQKVLACAYAWATLGGSHRPVTKLWLEDGDVFVDAPGDPTLSDHDFARWRRQLGDRFGRTVWVKGAFDIGVPPTWEHDDLPNRYAPRITAFTYNRSGVEVFVGPRGWERPDPFAEITLRRGRTTGDLAADFDLDHRKLTIHGAWPKQRTRAATIAMPDPRSAAAEALGGRFRAATNLPPGPPTITHSGRTISEIAKLCLEPSDNMLAEHLLLMAASREPGFAARPYSVAAASLKRWLETVVKTEPGDMNPTDGSGMSRHNLVTARGMARLLHWISQQEFAESFLQAMAAPGEGTLRTRLAGQPIAAKTGTLSRVSSLSGIILGPRRLQFSIVMNNLICPAATQREFQDRLVRELVSYASGTESSAQWRDNGNPAHPVLDADPSPWRAHVYWVP